jgi:tripartite-type tricarboxylate transporter receptor subunit TctC
MRNKIGHAISFAAGFLACLALYASYASPSHAQTWPQRSVHFVLPLGAGSGADIGARLLAERLTKRWGQTVVVENCPGGDGVVAINTVLNARDDHMLMFGPSSAFVAHPYLYDKMPYDQRDLLPVARFSITLVGLAAPGSFNVATLKDLMDLARAQPGKVNWATVTGVTDFIVAGYAKKAGIDMQKVPYRDTVQAQNDLAEGRIQMYIAALAIIRAQVQAGRIKLRVCWPGCRRLRCQTSPAIARRPRARSGGRRSMPSASSTSFPISALSRSSTRPTATNRMESSSDWR